MNISTIYILILIVIFAVIAFFVFSVSKNKKFEKITPLAGLAFGFVLAGIVFGDDRLIGYSLIGIGIVLAVIDAILKFRGK